MILAFGKHKYKSFKSKNILNVGLLFPLLLCTAALFCQTETHIRKKSEIKDGIAPKSVVSSGNGLFSAQNMMYRHTITLYNHTGELLAKINDGVRLSSYGITNYGTDKLRGAPVEGAFTRDGNFLWVSNYNMSGGEFTNPGCDACIGKDYDPSFLYKIDTKNFTIANVIEVGSVPKFLAISPDEKTLIVSNWVSSDVSIIDLETEKEVKRITVGAHPRGVAITQDSKFAYVTVMGSTKIAEVNLLDYTVDYVTDVGRSPRSVLLADNDSTLYVSLNSSNEILKYNRFSKTKNYCKTDGGPRSMTLSPDEKSLYVVNYFEDVFTKINTDSMQIEAVIPTSSKPIGICGNWADSEIWVACYSGKIEVFKDFKLEKELHPTTLFGLELPTLNFNPILPVDSLIVDTISPDIVALDTIATDTNLIAEEPIKVILPAITPRIQNRRERPLRQSPEPVITSNETCSYHLIIGAFSQEENAEKKKSELTKQGYAAKIIIGAQYNYVSIDCYTNKDLAEQGKTDIRQKVDEFSSAWILEW
ncbi:MAG: YVTN family beta-propeller protein [Crocinitomix sp.]|jgi:YVTN family beta-propeller protein